MGSNKNSIYCYLMEQRMLPDTVIATFTINGREVALTAQKANELSKHPALEKRVKDLMMIARLT